MMRFFFGLGLVLAVVGTACGVANETASVPGVGGGGAGGAPVADASSSSAGPSSGSSNTLGEAFTVTFDKITLMPGEENTKCVVKRVPNDGAIHVGNIHNVLSESSHHLIVYRVKDAAEQTTPFECQPFADLLKPEKGAPLMITQKHDDTLALPKGVSFAFEPGQMVRLEMHYINPTAEPREASASATFYAMPDADVKADADLLFVGNPDINLAPKSKATLGPTFVPVPAQLGDANFFGVTGHTHRFGTKVTVATAAAKGEPDNSVYDVADWQWGEPETVYHDPPFQVPAGGGFQFTCEWNNTSDQKVTFGESANDEMCFFWTYYYPSQGAFVCVHTDQVAGGVNLCCPGNPFCSKLFE
jgi:hypothetical protein